MHYPFDVYPMGEKPKSFDEKMREGQSMHCGLGGSMKMREPGEGKHWATRHHGTTRGGERERNY